MILRQPEAYEPWFDDSADASAYLGEVARLWIVWLLGLGALAFTDGMVAIVVGVGLLGALFVLMHPLQRRVQSRFGDSLEAKRPQTRSLSKRDRALRELSYGPRPFAEAVDKTSLPGWLRFVPWAVVAVTLVAAGVVAVQWLGG